MQQPTSQAAGRSLAPAPTITSYIARLRSIRNELCTRVGVFGSVADSLFGRRPEEAPTNTQEVQRAHSWDRIDQEILEIEQLLKRLGMECERYVPLVDQDPQGQSGAVAPAVPYQPFRG